MAAVLGEHGVWIEVLRHGQASAEGRLAKLEAGKPSPSPDRTELLKEINSGLRTFLAVVLVVAYLLGKISPEQVDVLKKAVSIAP